MGLRGRGQVNTKADQGVGRYVKVLDPLTLTVQTTLSSSNGIKTWCYIQDGDLLMFGNQFVKDKLRMVRVRIPPTPFVAASTVLPSGTCYIEELTGEAESRARVSGFLLSVSARVWVR